MKTRITILAFAAALLLSTLATAQPARRPASDAGAFTAAADRWVADALQQLNAAPGLAIAVVVGDEVVLARGYGMADVEKGLRSTDETLYYIASATKPFTALGAAILDARGTLALDDPLAKHLHGVVLAPELRPADVRLRDLLIHTSGIDNDPISFRLAYSGEHEPELLWKLLAKSTPMENAPLGTFRYTNVGYNIYAMIQDRETKRRWQDLLRDEIFVPLGMERTTAYASLPHEKGWPLAVPYVGIFPGGLKRIDLEKTDATMQSAGGMMTTARDLGRWLEFQLNMGRIDGRQVVEASIVKATHAKHADASGGRPPFGQTAYGLGWSHGSWRDHLVLHHSGGFPGFAALLSFMPEAGIGVAVLVNEGSVGGRLADLAAVWAYDWWLGVPAAEQAPPALLQETVAMRAKLAERIAADLRNRSERQWTLGHPKSFYTGRYSSALFGTVDISMQDDRLVVRQGNLQCIAEPFTKPETIRVELIPGSGRVIAFEIGDSGVDRIQLDGDAYERVR